MRTRVQTRCYCATCGAPAGMLTAGRYQGEYHHADARQRDGQAGWVRRQEFTVLLGDAVWPAWCRNGHRLDLDMAEARRALAERRRKLVLPIRPV